MAYTPVNGNRNGRVLLTLLLAAILAVAAVFGGYLWGHHTATAATQATAAVDVPAVNVAVPTVPAGPTRIVGGIPSGFSHDRNGAIAAGIGFLQAVASIDGGLSSPNAVQTQMAAANPSAAVLKEISGDGTSNPAPLPAGIVEGFNEAPIAVKVVAVSATSAQLSFWACFSGGTSNAPGQPINATSDCNLENVALSWEKGDWKIADYLFTNGGKQSVFELTRANGYQVLVGSYTVLTVSQP
jgi:hypothetical protein